MSIEELPNELLFDIMQYLDVYELYQSFDRLNTRFDSILYNKASFTGNLTNLIKDIELKCLYQTSLSEKLIYLKITNEINGFYDMIYKFFTLLCPLESLKNLCSLTLYGIGCNKETGFEFYPFMDYMKLIRIIFTTLSNLNYLSLTFVQSIDFNKISIHVPISSIRICKIYSPGIDFDDIELILKMCGTQLKCLSLAYLKEADYLRNISEKFEWLLLEYIYSELDQLQIEIFTVEYQMKHDLFKSKFWQDIWKVKRYQSDGTLSICFQKDILDLGRISERKVV
ncbi:unnamed protein product [Didymodactylos carnosus]|uniref:F-box domain-containing protein n=1 Tax=Didymodactylos carnosus TaxID=1234261 RepID=A0A8S2VMZ2_9BILA|nr:unnamed protein product [Didymodactylos carnosus]CAF4398924.1 unnamed protein product [Didymodactylos carnosus]